MLSQFESNLVVSLQAGDEQAFETLYDRYAAMMLGVICRIVKDREDAENLLQDCFVKIWKNIGTYNPDKGRLATWLINIARNTAIDFTRSRYFSQKKKNQAEDSFVLPLSDNRTTTTPIETIGLQQQLQNLPDSYKKVIEWMYFEGYTQQEIADKFNIPLGTVKTRARLAILALREIYKI